MDEMTQHIPDVDGDFTIDEESGFGCGRCGQILCVGSTVCPKCNRQFAVPTPSLKRLNASKHPAKMQGMALVYRGRLSATEIKVLLKQNPKCFSDGNQ